MCVGAVSMPLDRSYPPVMSMCVGVSECRSVGVSVCQANIADLPSRGHFELLHDFGSRPIELKIPPISDWLSPAEAARAAGGGFGRERGGRRGR